MSTKLQELSPTGCFGRAKDDEPMFVLLARDPKAPGLVRAWADQREQDIGTGKRPASDMRQVTQARETAESMEAWRDANDGMWREGMFAGHGAATLPQGTRHTNGSTQVLGGRDK